jgi:hypothetical protein
MNDIISGFCCAQSYAIEFKIQNSKFKIITLDAKKMGCPAGQPQNSENKFTKIAIISSSRSGLSALFFRHTFPLNAYKSGILIQTLQHQVEVYWLQGIDLQQPGYPLLL